ncbi:hypothetical protein V6R21_24230 [Limibacter armeniacum]|uniref:hypothetical protein n=1 Tax=Limibacter armeniacum TaxID=466084 RepID=UPI002FE5DDAF
MLLSIKKAFMLILIMQIPMFIMYSKCQTLYRANNLDSGTWPLSTQTYDWTNYVTPLQDNTTYFASTSQTGGSWNTSDLGISYQDTDEESAVQEVLNDWDNGDIMVIDDDITTFAISGLDTRLEFVKDDLTKTLFIISGTGVLRFYGSNRLVLPDNSKVVILEGGSITALNLLPGLFPTYIETTSGEEIWDYNDDGTVNGPVIMDGTGVEVLPIKLIFFSAKKQSESVILTWATASEKNNDYFEIQRSTDGKTYETIGKINGNGTTQSRVNYKYTDNPPVGILYYRLKQIDYNGLYEYFNLKYIHQINEKIDITLLGNPITNHQAKLQVNSPQSMKMQMRFISLDGKVIHQEYKEIPSGTTVLMIHLPALSPSNIILHIVTPNDQKSLKISIP